MAHPAVIQTFPPPSLLHSPPKHIFQQMTMLTIPSSAMRLIFCRMRTANREAVSEGYSGFAKISST